MTPWPLTLQDDTRTDTPARWAGAVAPPASRAYRRTERADRHRRGPHPRARSRMAADGRVAKRRARRAGRSRRRGGPVAPGALQAADALRGVEARIRRDSTARAMPRICGSRRN